MTRIGTDIQKAADLLRDEQLVAIPTETVYGLAGNALSTRAVTEIFRVKNRPFFDPLILHTDDLNKLEHLIDPLPPTLETLAGHFMPGPLTILAVKKSTVPDLVTSGLPKVAIRIPNHPVTLELLRRLDFPVAAPSANPFGYVSPTTAQHVMDQLGGSIPYILDGGPCQIGLESTIVDYDQGEIVVLRKGGIPVESIEQLAGPVKIRPYSSSQPLAPGMLDQHYAPRIHLSLEVVEQALAQYDPKKIGYLGFTKNDPRLPADHQMVLSPDGNLSEAARNFFAHLRILDNLDLDIIVAELVPEVGLGRAINDKLRRAAGNHDRTNTQSEKACSVPGPSCRKSPQQTTIPTFGHKGNL